MRRSVLDSEGSGPRAFDHRLRLVTGPFDHVNQAGAFLKLQNLGVPSGTPFTEYLRTFKALVASVTVIRPCYGAEYYDFIFYFLYCPRTVRVRERYLSMDADIVPGRVGR